MPGVMKRKWVELGGQPPAFRGGTAELSRKEGEGISFRRNSICKCKGTTNPQSKKLLKPCSLLFSWKVEVAFKLKGEQFIMGGCNSWSYNSRNSKKYSVPSDLMKPGLGRVRLVEEAHTPFFSMSSLFSGTMLLALHLHCIHICWIWLNWFIVLLFF